MTGNTSGTPPGADPSAPPTPNEPKPTIVRRSRSRGWAYAVVAVVVVIVLILGAGYGLGWFKKSTPATTVGACPSGQTISGAGASLVTAILTTWSYNYAGATGNTVNYDAAGAGAGATDFIDRAYDFAATDGPLNASQTAELPSTALTLPIVGGSVAIIYNVAGLSQPLNFNGNVLAGIYNGSIATWNNPAIAAINPGVTLPSSSIQTVHRLDAAGTTQVLTDYISRVNTPWKDGPGVGLSISWPTTPTPAKAISGNSKLAAYVNSTANTIGYVDLADAHAVTHVGIGAVLNPAGQYLVPTSANTASAIDHISAATKFPTSAGDWSSVDMVDSTSSGDYPLAALAYGFIYQALDKGYAPTLAKSQAIHQWFTWILTNGQQNASALFYAPLPASLVSVDEAGLATLTYDGSPLPACK